MSEHDRHLWNELEAEALRKQQEAEAWRWGETHSKCWHDWYRFDGPQGGYKCRVCGGWRPTL